MSSLPNQVNYSEPLLMLPENTTNFLACAQTVNASTFLPGTLGMVDLAVNRGFLDPASLSIRYKVTTTNTTGQSKIVGTPAYTFISKVVTYVNSQTVETISNYNTVANLHVNLSMGVSEKIGQMYSLGYVNAGSTSTAVTNELPDGRLCVATGESFFLSAPLIGLLGGSEKLIPLMLLQNIRLEFTFANAADVVSNLTGDSTTSAGFTYTISNFEVVYNVIDFGAEVQRQIIAENPKIRIKSSSYNTSIATLASGATGNQNLLYNLRYASIKSCFLNFGGTSATVSANKNMDSFDITSGNGDYSLSIAGTSYPQKALSTLNSKASIFNELRRAMGSLFGNNVALSINTTEFSKTDAVATSYDIPAKFWVGFNLQKLTVPSKAFFTGVSTANAPITAIINCNTATTQAYNVMLIANYDLIIDIDVQSKQCTIVS